MRRRSYLRKELAYAEAFDEILVLLRKHARLRGKEQHPLYIGVDGISTPLVMGRGALSHLQKQMYSK
jgi:hypothetical protein